MRLSEVKELLNCKCITGQELMDDYSVNRAFASDLMSDVLAFSDSNTLLLTGLTNPQVIRTAEMMDISAIVLVRGKQPSEETVKLAKETNIILLCTPLILYTSCGILHSKGLEGVCIE